MAKNNNLHKAQKAKNDEFYTQLVDIENELKHYRHHFVGKVVYCNCDDPKESNFFNFFSMNFESLCLKKLIVTGYNADRHGVLLTYTRDKNINKNLDFDEIDVNELEDNGDFRSLECIELLKASDIVVTNPPFSLFREYVATLIEYNKKFLILGNNNAIKYKEIFPLFKDNKIWLGVHSNKTMEFKLPDNYEKFNRIENGVKFGKVPSISWFTNLEHNIRNQPIDLYMKYSNEYYPKYDNYDAIEVSKTCEIPMDYNGVMGVPITFLNKYNPEQFEIIGVANHGRDNKYDLFEPILNSKKIYTRILIKHRR